MNFKKDDKVNFTNFYGEDCGTRIVKDADEYDVEIMWNLAKGLE